MHARTGFSALGVTCLSLFAIGLVPGHRAHAGALTATTATGVYVVIDPYSTSDYKRLQTAAATPCPKSAPSTPASTFCGGVDGILLRAGWCKFEPDHASHGGSWNSCRYILGYKNGPGSPAAQYSISPNPEYGTSCNQNFDVCNGATPGTMATVLGFINRINTNRTDSGWLPPLKLSVGLAAGIWTPETVMAAVGSVDVPAEQSATGAAAAERCVRLPQPWSAAYTTDYDTALSQWLHLIATSLPNAGNVQTVKVAGISSFDLETMMPGMASPVAAPGTDPGKPHAFMGAPLQCSSTVPPAQIWLSAYGRNAVAGRNFSQAVEYSFGTMTGYAAATIANDGMPASLSVATTGGAAFANIDCGMSGSGSCSISPRNGDYSVYYLTRYVSDLFDGGLAGQAAAAAYSATRPGSGYALTPSDISVVWTALTHTAINPANQLGCILNNTDTAHDATMVLNNSRQSIQGVGTLIGWQTQTQQGGTCSAKAGNSYLTALDNGIAEGGRLLEVEGDAAFNDFATCGPDLAHASAAIAGSTATNCLY